MGFLAGPRLLLSVLLSRALFAFKRDSYGPGGAIGDPRPQDEGRRLRAPPPNNSARRCRPGRCDRLSGPWEVLDAGTAPDAAGVRAVASEAGDEWADTEAVTGDAVTGGPSTSAGSCPARPASSGGR